MKLVELIEHLKKISDKHPDATEEKVIFSLAAKTPCGGQLDIVADFRDIFYMYGVTIINGDEVKKEDLEE